MDDESDDDTCPTVLKDFKVGEFFLIHEDRYNVALFGVCAQDGAVTHTKRLGYFKGYNGSYYGHEVKAAEDFDSTREVEFWENTWIEFGKFWEAA